MLFETSCYVDRSNNFIYDLWRLFCPYYDHIHTLQSLSNIMLPSL